MIGCAHSTTWFHSTWKCSNATIYQVETGQTRDFIKELSKQPREFVKCIKRYLTNVFFIQTCNRQIYSPWVFPGTQNISVVLLVVNAHKPERSVPSLWVVHHQWPNWLHTVSITSVLVVVTWSTEPSDWTKVNNSLYLQMHIVINSIRRLILIYS